MSDAPRDRFTGLADTYAKYRPTYPDAAFDFVVTEAGLPAGGIVADIGAGTDISARWFAQRGYRTLALEPNADMKAKGSASTPECEWLAAGAEDTGLDSKSVDLVLAAQAFHWFDAARALLEFQRICRGAVALVWNERHELDPATAAFGAIVGGGAAAEKVERQRADAGQRLLESTLFVRAKYRTFEHSQALDEDGVVGRALSASYAPKDNRDAYVARLRAAFAQYQVGGVMTLVYVTRVFTAHPAH